MMCCDASGVCVQGQEGVLSQAKNDINTTSHQIESKVCKPSDVENCRQHWTKSEWSKYKFRTNASVTAMYKPVFEYYVFMVEM